VEKAIYSHFIEPQSNLKGMVPSHHGAIWEALPAMEHLLRHLEHLKQTVSKQDTRIWECINNSWAKLNEYYSLTDNKLQGRQ
jgi:hypothetical protein